ncbi:hypothetical protein [Bdellovibrio sp. HCB337]|uniref:hypothetical protein n=1 Tax=Bdellovibrio sp. HCB337 TaxID=3394358 RepID=UPI0039A6B949
MSLAALTLLSGCSMDAQLLDLREVGKVFNNSQLAGFVSSSAQNEKTAAGYKIQSSSGDYSNRIEETTSGGYKVYISAQGNIISDN